MLGNCLGIKLFNLLKRDMFLVRYSSLMCSFSMSQVPLAIAIPITRYDTNYNQPYRYQYPPNTPYLYLYRYRFYYRIKIGKLGEL